MLTALLDGLEEWEARVVERLSESERSAMHGRWTCPGCGNEAYFVRRSRNGHAARFASRHHAEDCVEQSRPSQIRGDREEVSVPPISNDAERLILRLGQPGLPTTTRTHRRAWPEAGDGVTRRHTQHGASQPRHDQSHGLAPLLGRLKRDPAFRLDDRPFRLDDGTWTTVRKCCFHAENFPTDRLRTRIIVWGVVFTAGDNWINSGPKGSGRPAMRLANADMEVALKRAHVDTAEELIGSMFIVVGVFSMTRTGVPFTKPHGHQVAFLPR